MMLFWYNCLSKWQSRQHFMQPSRPGNYQSPINNFILKFFLFSSFLFHQYIHSPITLLIDQSISPSISLSTHCRPISRYWSCLRFENPKQSYQDEISESFLHLHCRFREPLLVERVHHHNFVVNHRGADGTTARFGKKKYVSGVLNLRVFEEENSTSSE